MESNKVVELRSVYIPHYGFKRASELSEWINNRLDVSADNVIKGDYDLALSNFRCVAYVFNYLDGIFYRLDPNGLSTKQWAKAWCEVLKKRLNKKCSAESLWSECAKVHDRQGESIMQWERMHG